MKKILIATALVLVLLLALVLLPDTPGKPDVTQQPATIQLRDAHGLAVDRKDSSRVYIATHTGLLVLTSFGQLQRVGSAQDDYMGFSAHPSDSNTFFTSGHLSSGGNIGFQKSTDGGQSWQKISDGINGPVDFHTMTVSLAEPNTIFGTYQGQLQRSRDAGNTWEILSAAPTKIYTLATSSIDPGTVYAGTAEGLYVSRNHGQSWTKIEAIKAAVTSLTAPSNAKEDILAFVQGQGLLRSTDAGASWTALSGYSGTTVIQLAYDPNNPDTIYLINQNLEIHRSSNGGQNWDKVI